MLFRSDRPVLRHQQAMVVVARPILRESPAESCQPAAESASAAVRSAAQVRSVAVGRVYVRCAEEVVRAWRTPQKRDSRTLCVRLPAETTNSTTGSQWPVTTGPDASADFLGGWNSSASATEATIEQIIGTRNRAAKFVTLSCV